MATREQQKTRALELMQKMGIYKPYIDAFEKDGMITTFEGYGGFWTTEDNGADKDLLNKIKEIENKHNCVVYAITHEVVEFGELYDLLIVQKEKNEWDYSFYDNGNTQYTVFAYVYNKSIPEFSEFGDIIVHSFGGGIRRIA